jgi:hypothetical protein
MGIESSWSISGTFSVPVTEENIDRIREVIRLRREVDPYEDDDSSLAVGSEYLFASGGSGEMFDEIGSPFINISSVSASEVLSLGNCEADEWDDELFTAWAAIAGPYEIFLQVLDGDGEHELTVTVSATDIKAKESFTPSEDEEDEEDEDYDEDNYEDEDEDAEESDEEE